MRKYIEPVLPGSTLHIFGKTVGNEIAFISEGYYNFFLNQFQKYIFPFSRTYAYALLPDQFHFVLTFDASIPDASETENFLSTRFGNIINSYTKTFNIEQNRKGNLFVKPFFRYEIYNITDLPEVIRHVHWLPVFHGLTSSAERWKYSSYFPLINLHASLVDWDDLADLFGDLDRFQQFHHRQKTYQMKFPPWDALRPVFSI